MKIGIDISVLNEQNRTGIGTYVYELVSALLEIDSKNEYILFALSPLANFNYMQNLEFKKFPNVRLKIYKMPARVFRRAFLLWQRVNFPPIDWFTEEVDLFHSFNWFLPPQKKGKVVATIFDLTAIAYPQWHYQRTTQLDRVRLNRIKKYADLVLAISENSKADFLQFSPHSNVDVVYPSSSHIYEKKYSQEESLRVLKKYNLTPGYYLSVSTLEPRKNLEGLINAYLKTAQDKKLLLVGGKGWKNNQLLKLIKKNSGKIIMAGFLENKDMPILFQQALCLIYPSFYEGFGIPILEAFNSKIPVISSNTSSMPEVGGDAVFYVNPHRINEIAQALEQIKDDDFRQKLIKKGLLQAKKFSWKLSAKKQLELYRKICT